MTEKYIRLDDVMTIIARKHLFKDKTDFDKCVHAIAEQIKALPTVEAVPLSVIEKIKANIDKLPDLNPDYPMDMTTHVSKWAVFDIIDKAVKEIKDER